MKNIIIFTLLLLILWVLYSLNIQYGWVELQMNWTKVFIAIAAAGGPIQYLQNKLKEKKEEELANNPPQFRTMTKEDYQKTNRHNNQL